MTVAVSAEIEALPPSLPLYLGGDITAGTATLIALLLISRSEFTLFAMWFDMESNKDLR